MNGGDRHGSLGDVIRHHIRSEGPLPFAQFMELALYHPELGYYARAAQRSGRTGDFITSVDIGSLYGELLAVQFAQMWEVLRDGDPIPRRTLEIVEAAAGNGRLSRDVLRSAQRQHPGLYDAVRLTLVERSARARRSQRGTLGPHAAKLAASLPCMPPKVTGIIFANELLDALPVHPVVMTETGLREVFVDVSRADEHRFVERLGPPGRDVEAHVQRFDIALPPGTRAEVSPAVVRWVEQAAESLDRGFLVIVDYGHPADELYSPTHAAGTLTTYRRHVAQTAGDSRWGAPWLGDPGSVDMTAHVDLTAVSAAATASGLVPLAMVDQAYFLLGLGAVARPEPTDPVAALKQRLALKSLLLPGGLGSTHKVLIFGARVGTPSLHASAFARRLT